MQQRDLIKEQIEQAGRVLGKILSGLAGWQTTASVQQTMNIVQRQFRSELDFDLEAWLQSEDDDQTDRLARLPLPESALDELASFLYEIGQQFSMSGDPAAAQTHFRGARAVLDRVDAVSETLTFERMDLRRAVEGAMDE